MPEEPAIHNPFAPLNSAKIISAFSTRFDGNMSLSYGDTRDSVSCRRNFLGKIGINYEDLVTAKQIHSDKIKYAKEEDSGMGALHYDTAVSGTDAFVTNRKKVPVAILTADCLSVFLYDPRIMAAGLVHAGWRSTKEKISLKTVQFMQRQFASSPEDIYASFGPCIRSCCYEVGEDFIPFFPFGLIKPDESHYYLDLPAINKKQLLDAGLKEDKIFDCGLCTCCRNDEFFSFRKEGDACGRGMSVIMLKG